MLIEVVIDVQNNVNDLFSSSGYLPSDVIIYRYDDDLFMDYDTFFNNVKNDIKKGVWDVSKKKSET